MSYNTRTVLMMVGTWLFMASMLVLAWLFVVIAFIGAAS